MNTRDLNGAMKRSAAILNSLNLPVGDSDDLPESNKRFQDGAKWKIEIPSVEGPKAMATVIAEAKERNVPVARVSQGSGIMLLTDSEISEMVDLGKKNNIEVCLFVGPRASWDIGKQATTQNGSVSLHSLRGADQVRFAIEDVLHGADLGIRSILVGDIGLLKVLGQARAKGDIPSDFIFKTSVALPCLNPAMAEHLVSLGANTLNLATDLSLGQIAAIRQAVDVPVDVYVEGPDDFGSPVRYYEIPDLVRVAAPIYLKFTVRNAPGIYPAGGHLEGVVLATAKERVRRASIGLSLLSRYTD